MKYIKHRKPQKNLCTISVSGVDGAGKSSVLKLLNADLKKNGYRVKYLWVRGGYTPIVVFLKSFVRSLSFGRLPKAGISSARTNLLKINWIQKIWLSISILEMLFIYSVVNRVHLARGYTVLCDRYIFDTQIDFQIMFPGVNFQDWIIWKTLLRFHPKQRLSFLLIIPYEVSKQRCSQKYDPFPDEDDTRKLRLKLYAQLVDPSIQYIDASLSINEVYEKILNCLFEKSYKLK